MVRVPVSMLKLHSSASLSFCKNYRVPSNIPVGWIRYQLVLVHLWCKYFGLKLYNDHLDHHTNVLLKALAPGFC